VKRINLEGKRFGALVVVSAHPGVGGQLKWLCKCDCGTEKLIRADHLKAGKILSCGCQTGARISAAKAPLGAHHASPAYGCWIAMRARCHSPESTAYPQYGARGVTVCDRWRDDFKTFLADMGERPSMGHSLDRYPNRTGNYEPGNVRWATFTEQARNKDSNRTLTYNGESHSIVEWSEIVGVSATLIQARLDRLGWSVAKSLSEPAKSGRSNSP
jgi:hypothetical protein